jgi:hypothetical protein
LPRKWNRRNLKNKYTKKSKKILKRRKILKFQKNSWVTPKFLKLLQEFHDETFFILLNLLFFLLNCYLTYLKVHSIKWTLQTMWKQLTRGVACPLVLLKGWLRTSINLCENSLYHSIAWIEYMRDGTMFTLKFKGLKLARTNLHNMISIFYIFL